MCVCEYARACILLVVRLLLMLFLQRSVHIGGSNFNNEKKNRMFLSHLCHHFIHNISEVKFFIVVYNLHNQFESNYYCLAYSKYTCWCCCCCYQQMPVNKSHTRHSTAHNVLTIMRIRMASPYL